MRLNHDYVRDILLFIESELTFDDNGKHQELMFGKLLVDDNFKKHDENELLYALELLIQEGYINCAKQPYFVRGSLMNATIIGLTWQGHQLLDNVRNNTVWNAVKNKAVKFGGFSLSVLSHAANAVGMALMNDPDALHNLEKGIEDVSKLFG